RIGTELARAQIKAKRRPSVKLETKVHDGAVGGHRKDVCLTSKVRIGRSVRPVRSAVGLQQFQKRVCTRDDEPILWQGRQARNRLAGAAQGTPRATARTGPSQKGAGVSLPICPARVEGPTVPRPSDN